MNVAVIFGIVSILLISMGFSMRQAVGQVYTPQALRIGSLEEDARSFLTLSFGIFLFGCLGLVLSGVLYLWR